MLQYQKEFSEKDWETIHLLLAEWYRERASRLETEKEREKLFEDKEWRLLLIEKHFHQLCANYKKYLPELVQDFASILRFRKWEDAVPFTTALKESEATQRPKSWGDLLTKGLNTLINGQSEGALAMFKATNETGWIEAIDDKSFFYLRQGVFELDKEKAIECYKKAVNIKPDNHVAWRNMGYTFFDLDNNEEAIKCYEKVLHLKPEDDRAWRNMGNTYFNLGNEKKAIECYEKVLDINPEDARTWNNMANLYTKLRQKEKAIECFEKAIGIEPDLSRAWLNLAYLYDIFNQKKKAIEFYEKVVEITPDDDRAWRNMGHAFSNLEQKKKAINCYKTVLNIKPDDFRTWHNLGDLYSSLKKKEKADECFEKANIIKLELGEE